VDILDILYNNSCVAVLSDDKQEAFFAKLEAQFWGVSTILADSPASKTYDPNESTELQLFMVRQLDDEAFLPQTLIADDTQNVIAKVDEVADNYTFSLLRAAQRKRVHRFVHRIATAKIVFDAAGEGERIKQEAKTILRKGPTKLAPSELDHYGESVEQFHELFVTESSYLDAYRKAVKHGIEVAPIPADESSIIPRLAGISDAQPALDEFTRSQLVELEISVAAVEKVRQAVFELDEELKSLFGGVAAEKGIWAGEFTEEELAQAEKVLGKSTVAAFVKAHEELLTGQPENALGLMEDVVTTHRLTIVTTRSLTLYQRY
jgi:hypothetical protein